jgi:hypothetical protein
VDHKKWVKLWSDFTWVGKISVAVSCKLGTNLRVLGKVKYLLADWATISFSRIILLSGVVHEIIIYRHVIVWWNILDSSELSIM